MPAAINEPVLFWQVHQPPPGSVSSPKIHPEVTTGRPRKRGSSDPIAPESGAWRSQIFDGNTAAPGKVRATRYEKFTTRMVMLSAVLTLGITAGLHVFNYELETKTSSTSGTHSGFYKEDE